MKTDRLAEIYRKADTPSESQLAQVDAVVAEYLKEHPSVDQTQQPVESDRDVESE